MRSPLGTSKLSLQSLELAMPMRRALRAGPWWVSGWFVTLSLALSLALILAGSSMAFAATTPAAAPDEDTTLAEVVVTANKRAQDTKDVPVSIGVVDSQEILDLHIEDAIAVFCGESQQCHGRAHGLRHRERAVPHVPSVRVGSGARVAALHVQHAVDDEPARADVVWRGVAVERVEPRTRRRGRQRRPRLDGRLEAALEVERRA